MGDATPTALLTLANKCHSFHRMRLIRGSSCTATENRSSAVVDASSGLPGSPRIAAAASAHALGWRRAKESLSELSSYTQMASHVFLLPDHLVRPSIDTVLAPLPVTPSALPSSPPISTSACVAAVTTPTLPTPPSPLPVSPSAAPAPTA